MDYPYIHVICRRLPPNRGGGIVLFLPQQLAEPEQIVSWCSNDAGGVHTEVPMSYYRECLPIKAEEALVTIHEYSLLYKVNLVPTYA